MRLLLADDHALFRYSLQMLLETSGYTVVGMAADGREALQQARALQPDLILMDIEMPLCNGLVATRLIKAELPAVKVVMLTASSSDEDLFEAVKSGASGYLLKSQSADSFLEMVGHVAAGGAALPPDLAARLLDEFARQARRIAPVDPPPDKSNAGAPISGAEQGELTPRQVEILSLLAQGMTYAQIGAVLYLSEPTVRYHLAQIMDRLHLQNRAQVIAYAASHGMA
ncbi:MAG: response regulator transcription factor [Caldilineaceae bacterium]